MSGSLPKGVETDVDLDAESRRVIAEYERRERDQPPDYYALHHLRNLFVRQEHERMLLRCLRRAGLVPLSERRVLEVGCGHGEWLAVFESLGARRENVAGIELGHQRAEQANRRLPGSDIRAGDAARLPWSDQSFDVVFQRMMFTSILDPTVRRVAAEEMMRVARPDGAIVWVDFFINPFNPQVRCLGRKDIHDLFPGWQATLYRTTLAPPLSRRLVNISWGLARALEQLRIFNTFYFGFLQRRR
jgi:SAM-dependent methyltransferase